MKSIFKNFFFGIAVVLLVISCDKSSLQQTSNTIKQADSLINNVNQGYKTLDSISKIVNDSAKLNSEIRKHKEIIEKNIDIKSINVKNLDSLSQVLDKFSRNVSTGSDVAKTIDSVSKVIENSKNPIEAISTISKTIEKVSKQTKTKNQRISKNQKDTIQSNNSYPQQQTTVIQNPITKNAQLEVLVNNLQEAHSQLGSQLANYNADIVTESFTNAEGMKQQYLTIKVPLNNFDKVVTLISGSLGSTTMKSIASEGTEFRPNQMCDIAVTLKEDQQLTAQNLPTSEANKSSDTFGDQSSEAFNKGFSFFKKAFIFLLPLWPFLLIGGIVWYFISRNKRKKREIELRQQVYETKLREKEISDVSEKQEMKNTETPSEPKKENNGETDYSKYMPK